MAKRIEKMTRKELVAALLQENPFGGYSVQSKQSTESLRETLKRYRNVSGGNS
jgi:hypothetical protein